MRLRSLLILATLVATLVAAAPALAQKSADGGRALIRTRPVPEALAPAAAAVVAPASPLDPALQMLARTAGPGKQAAQRARAADLGLALTADGAVRVLLEEVPGSAGAASLAAAGVVVEERVGRTVVARIPVEALADVARSGVVRRVEGVRRRRPHLAAARADARVDAVHAGTGLSRAYTGVGAVVGVVDSGLDLAHADVNTSTGTRLLAVRSDAGPARRTFTRAQIDAAPATARAAMADTVGHGTHVTGILGGGGRLNTTRRGAAPGADIVSVQTDFFDDSIIEGCGFVFAQARAVNKPAVCNLSLGGHYGPHDGTSLFERSLSALVAPGYMVVASAGNEGEAYLHTGGAITAGKTASALFVTSLGATESLLNGWFDASTVRTVKVVAYSADDTGNLVRQAETPAFTVGGAAQNAVRLSNAAATYAFVSFESEALNPDNGDGQFTILLSDDGDPAVDIGLWYFELLVSGTANGRFDVWEAYGSGYFDDVSRSLPATFTELLGSPAYSAASPATARSIVSVGSHVTSNTYIDGGGRGRSTSEVLGQIASYSSRGPSRDGRTLPTLSAPGELVASALSSISVGLDQVSNEEVAQGGGYAYFGGTSMSAPMVAGVVALMLEANPRLTFDQVSRILTETARRDAQTGATAGNTWGAGKLDATAAVREAARLATPADAASRVSGLALEAIGPNPLRGQTTVRFALDGIGAPADLVVYDALGRTVLRLAAGVSVPGIHEATLDASALAPGVYVVALRAGGTVQTRPVVVVR